LEEADRRLVALLGEDPLPQIGAEAALLRCEVLLQMRNEAEAALMSELILSMYRNSEQYAESLWVRGKHLESEGKTQEALALFYELAMEYPNSPRIDGAMYHLGWDDWEAGDKRDARAKFMSIYKTKPPGEYWSHATWALAYLAYESKDLDIAELYVQQLLLHPPDAAILDRALYLKGELAMAQGNWTVAESAFRTLTRVCRDSPLVSAAKANATLAQNNINGVAESASRTRK